MNKEKIDNLLAQLEYPEMNLTRETSVELLKVLLGTQEQLSRQNDNLLAAANQNKAHVAIIENLQQLKDMSEDAHANTWRKLDVSQAENTKLRETLEMLADHMPSCDCMDARGLAREALAKAGQS